MTKQMIEQKTKMLTEVGVDPKLATELAGKYLLGSVFYATEYYGADAPSFLKMRGDKVEVLESVEEF